MTLPIVEVDATTIPTAAEARTAELKAAGVRYAAISFVDVHGRAKAKVVPIDHLPHTVEGSELFTGAALDGVPQEVNDDEVAARCPTSTAA